jgi:4-alpha-glucanotransferase
MDSRLDRLAEEHAISLTRPSPENVDVPISGTPKRMLLAALSVEGNPLSGP